jgi:hypothetical protein
MATYGLLWVYFLESFGKGPTTKSTSLATKLQTKFFLEVWIEHWDIYILDDKNENGFGDELSK